MKNNTKKEGITIDYSSKDNRPKWVIYFDRVLWIITIILVGYFIYQYNFNFYDVKVYGCNNQQIASGKVMNLNLSEFMDVNNFSKIEVTKGEYKIKYETP